MKKTSKEGGVKGYSSIGFGILIGVISIILVERLPPDLY
jgi:hypothetical protein